MSWRALTAANAQGRFTASEQLVLASVSGAGSKLTERLTDSVGKFVGAMRAAGYPVNVDGTVPDQLRNHIAADAVWEWLKDFPSLKAFKTKERSDAAATAEKVYEKIVQKEYGAIEAPAGPDTTGNWGSDNALVMRTWPTPPRSTQFQTTGLSVPPNANPNATSEVVQPLAPEPPKNLVPSVSPGRVYLVWDVPNTFITFTVYRGAGNAALVALAAGLSGSSYTDTAVTPGQTYSYAITALNAVGESAKSVPTTVTAK